MFFLKRALKYLKNKKNKAILLGIILVVIANVVTAGLMIASSADVAKEQTRLSIGSEISYVNDMTTMMQDMQKGLLTRDDVSVLQKGMQAGISESEFMSEKGSPTVSNFQTVVDSEYVSTYSAGIEASVINDLLKGFSTDTDEGGTGEFTLSLQLSSSITNFNNGTDILIEGRMFTEDEIKNGEQVVLIEKEVAELNDLKVGDYISLTGSQTVQSSGFLTDELDFEVVGIYETSEVVDSQSASRFGSTALPNNRIYASIYVMDDIDNVLLTSSSIELIDPENMDVFIDEANESINMVYGTLDANDALYNSLVGSIDSLGQISNVLVIVVIIAGLGILGLINALTINERREEIGILLAIGESKLKIIGQFIVEIALISLIAFSLSAVTGSIIGKRVTDSLLDSDMITNNLELGSGQLTTNEQGGKNNRVAGGGFNQMNPMMNVEPVEFDVSLSFGVLLQIYGLGLMLAITSTMIPALHVMRYNPKQILSNRES